MKKRKDTWVLVIRDVCMQLIAVIGPFKTKCSAKDFMMKYTEHEVFVIDIIRAREPRRLTRMDK